MKANVGVGGPEGRALRHGGEHDRVHVGGQALDVLGRRYGLLALVGVIILFGVGSSIGNGAKRAPSAPSTQPAGQ